jgi:thioester reductase-like protein
MSHDDFDDRVAAVCGDLSLPLLGVGPDSFGRLSKEIDLIVHCGTLVHAIYNYRKLKAPNVGGTVEVLRLATSFRPKHVVHISTLSVFPLLTRAQLSNGKRPVYTEDMIPSSFEALHDGYAQSKFVAELVALEARRRGVSVSIVRPGRISGGVGDGGGNTDDFISILIKGCIQLGMWPDLDWDIDLIPANVCAKVVMHTAEAQMSGRTDLIVHAVNRKHLIPLRQLVLNLRKFGFTVNEMPYNVWRASVAAAGDDNALTPLLAALPVDKADMIDNETAPVFDDAMEQSLASEVLNSAVVTDELLTSYLKWFVDRGFLPRPAKADEDVFQMDMEG